MTLEDIISCIQGGNAGLQIRSLKAGTVLAYQITESRDGKSFFVSWCSAGKPVYIGVMQDGTFRRTAKSRVSKDHLAFRTFAWLWGHLCANRVPSGVEIILYAERSRGY
jgi:hypothetical protein